ncbi:MAG: hypothetical protein JXB85_05685, partial [Anaerolineales bacterium]|nr:hypothetical protein [Anaerolineales bacterium]
RAVLLEYLMQCLRMYAVFAADPAFILAFHQNPPAVFRVTPLSWDDVRCFRGCLYAAKGRIGLANSW